MVDFAALSSSAAFFFREPSQRRMMKLIFLIAFLMLMTLGAPAFAQEVNVSGSVGVHALPNQSSGNRFNNVGLSADLAAHIDRFAIGGSVYGADNNPSRAFYFGSYRVLDYGRHSWSVGGGFHTFGALTRGFGQGGYNYDGWLDGLVRVGDEDTVHVQAGVRIAQFANGHVSLWPTYTYYHTRYYTIFGCRRDVDLHTVGLRIGLKGKVN
jgi:hypothetical protein